MALRESRPQRRGPQQWPSPSVVSKNLLPLLLSGHPLTSRATSAMRNAGALLKSAWGSAGTLLAGPYVMVSTTIAETALSAIPLSVNDVY